MAAPALAKVTNTDSTQAYRVRRICIWTGVVATTIGAIVLAGWLLDVAALRGPFPGLIEMKANTAIAFVLAGLALSLVPIRSSRAAAAGLCCALVAGGIGAVSLAEYLFDWNAGIDELLFADKPGAAQTVDPGRLAPQTAVNFILVAGSLLLLRTGAGRRRLVAGQALATTAGLIALFAILGYAYNAGSFRGVSAFSPMALHTAVAFLILSFGLLSARGEVGLLSSVGKHTAGGIMARRLIAVAIVVVPALGWLRTEGEDAGLYDTDTGVALLVVGVLLVLAIGILAAARALDRAERERRRAELRAQGARKEAERANRAKNEFLSRMSHELRTPLNSVIGFAQLLELEDLDEKQRDCVERIDKAGRHLLDLINEVLDISRIEAGKMTISIEPVHVGSVLLDVIELGRPLAHKQGVRIEPFRQIDGVYVAADQQRLKQIVLNLLSNAVKYNDTGGGVAVSCEDRGDGMVEIGVSDTGPGIPADRLSKLFVPFERLGAEGSGVEGTGLGLALSRTLAEAMGGTLEVETEVGVGTTFTLSLRREQAPIHPSAPSEPAMAHANDGDLPSRSVLYIEDNPSNVKLVEAILAHRPDLELMVASDGRVGLELAIAHRPDLVLLDVHLPEMGGVEVLRRLREDPATSRIPVLVVSADATAGQLERLRETGANAYLTKPLDVRRFLATVDETIAANPRTSVATKVGVAP
jgi:signal transduction histidine kinase/CheY-like chemotaxis protein